ncbi:MAG: hypothetical protein GY931_19240 [Maribacter sp.]|nr:hypothetical protein [Maribacter sp.]
MKLCIRILFSTLLFVSIACKKKTKTDVKDRDDITVEIKSEVNSEEAKTTEFKEVKDCDDFIDKYEEWMEEYLAILEKYKGNPIDLVNSSEYTQKTMQAMDWASNWSAKLTTSCAANPAYEKRMRGIQEKMEKKLKEMDLKNN